MTTPSALYLTGASGEYVSTPNSSDWRIAGDTAFVAKILPDSWTTRQIILSREYFEVEFTCDNSPAGELFVVVNNSYPMNSGVALSSSDPLWVAVSIDVDNGSSDADVKFWTGGTGDTPSWSQSGSTQNPGTTLTITTSRTSPLCVGIRANDLSSLPFAGNIYQAMVYDGLGGDHSAPDNGTLVAEFRADAPIEPRYRDSTGKIWTLNGSAFSFVEVA